MIEAALAESAGRVSGPGGAAGKLGIPRATLDAKMQAIGNQQTSVQSSSVETDLCLPGNPVTFAH